MNQQNLIKKRFRSILLIKARIWPFKRNLHAAKLLIFCTTLICSSNYANEQDQPQAAPCESWFVFSWSLVESCLPAPRGGTTQGAPITLDTAPSKAWQQLQALPLQEQGQTKIERDRQAILAMAGPYRASFEFIETLGFNTDYKPVQPYQSWGTEYIYVVEERPDFVSLQHIMVMFIQQKDDIIGPMVMKHWRQDWQYQAKDILEYTGHNTWTLKALSKSSVKGKWVQTVYQVDDSPRYASMGQWQHNRSFSRWQSDLTWRPLPRRESSVRNDYDVLEGYNTHVITATGWVQEEENLKLKLNKAGQPAQSMPYLARELGNNRYQRIKEFDFSAGDDYWKKTGPFWHLVRKAWVDLFNKHKQLTIKKEYKGVPLFSAMFELAEAYGKGTLKPNAAQTKLTSTLMQYIEPH